MPELLSTRYATAFITGASSGIGLAFAEMLLAEGVKVWGTARSVSRLIALVQKYPGLFTPVPLDLADADAALKTFENAAAQASITGTTADALGGNRFFDIVINNAGYGIFAPFAEADVLLWRRQIKEMISTNMALSHAALRGMLARDRGCLVNVSSLAAMFPIPYMSGYNVAKAGLSAFTESLMYETRGTRVSVIDFCPGDYRTQFGDIMRPTAADAAYAEKTARVWRTVDRQMREAPPPKYAARDLRRALLRGRSATVRSGGLFQAKIAPFGARFLPGWLVRALSARYFGMR